MYSYGKTDGSFRCSASATGKYWNRVYCMRERVYTAVLDAVVNEVLSLDGVRDAVFARVKELHEKGGAVATEIKKLDKEERRLLAAIERFPAAVESGDGALVSLTSRLAEREQELVIGRARRQEVGEQVGRKEKLPSEAKLLEHLRAVEGQLFGDEARAAVAGPLRKKAAAANELPVLFQRKLFVNAFAEPELVRHARLIVTRRLEGKTYKEIAKECNLTKYHMENCARITLLMEEAGLPEPYQRLTDKPAKVSPWCSKHWLKVGERKGGGRRRRAG